MANSLSNWQDSLNEGLVNRLNRPLRQPGMMKMAMGERIINRCDRFLNRLPLLSQQMQRWGNTNTLSDDAVPIVYAQPISLPKEQNIENRGHNSQPIISEDQPATTIIQRKLDSSQSLPIRTVNNTIPVQNSTDLSSSQQKNLSPNLSPTRGEALKPTFQLKLDETSISSSEIPVVSPQLISQQLLTTEEMRLAGLTESPISGSNKSELNLNYPSEQLSEIAVVSPLANSEELLTTEEMRLASLTKSPISAPTTSELNLNYPSEQLSEIAVVSPLANSEELLTTEEMRLASLTKSPISAPTTSELNLNYPSEQLSEIAVVLPLANSEELLTTEEMRLASLTKSPISAPTTSELNLNYPSEQLSEIPVVSLQPIAEQPLPIIQAKLQNDSNSQSFLPIVNNLNPLIDQEQRQQKNYTNLSTVKSKTKNLISQISSKALPIATAETLKYENNLHNTEISLAINSQNYQNQHASISNTQPVNVSNSQINQTNNKQNFSFLPVVTVNSPINPSLKPQSSPLPLAKTTPLSRNNSQQPNLSNRNSISNTDSSSTTKTFASSLSPKETSVSTIASKNAEIDINAIASQVERKLMRKLVIESERRGKIR